MDTSSLFIEATVPLIDTVNFKAKKHGLNIEVLIDPS